MDIPTRTPEGWPGRCPTCGAEVCIDPSWPTRDAICPRCGTLVWLRPPAATVSWPGRVAGLGVMAIAIVSVWLAGIAIGLTSADLCLSTFLGLLLFGRRVPELTQ